MTGLEFAQWLLHHEKIEGVRIEHGAANAYVPGERVLVLRGGTIRGRDTATLAVVAHEVGHAAQEARWGPLVPPLRWLLAGRLWLEWDATRWALRRMRADGREEAAAVLRASWRGYVRPALWQTAALLALAGWMWWKG